MNSVKVFYKSKHN